jgi:hypothetical protein
VVAAVVAEVDSADRADLAVVARLAAAGEKLLVRAISLRNGPAPQSRAVFLV